MCLSLNYSVTARKLLWTQSLTNGHRAMMRFYFSTLSVRDTSPLKIFEYVNSFWGNCTIDCMIVLLILLYPHIFFGTVFEEIMFMRDFKCCTAVGMLQILHPTWVYSNHSLVLCLFVLTNQIKYMQMVYCVSAVVFLRDFTVCCDFDAAKIITVQPWWSVVCLLL